MAIKKRVSSMSYDEAIKYAQSFGTKASVTKKPNRARKKTVPRTKKPKHDLKTTAEKLRRKREEEERIRKELERK